MKYQGETIQGALPIIKVLEEEFGNSLNDDQIAYFSLLSDFKECLTYYLYCSSNWCKTTTKVPLLYYYFTLREYPDNLYFTYSKKLQNCLESFSILLLKNNKNDMEYFNGK